MSSTPPLPPSSRSRKVETFTEKLYRKCSAQPLVPVGCGITCVFLYQGLKSFQNGQAARSQKMMRGRVLAQGVTVVIMCSYAAYAQFYPKPQDTELERDKKVRIHFLVTWSYVVLSICALRKRRGQRGREGLTVRRGEDRLNALPFPQLPGMSNDFRAPLLPALLTPFSFLLRVFFFSRF